MKIATYNDVYKPENGQMMRFTDRKQGRLIRVYLKKDGWILSEITFLMRKYIHFGISVFCI